eukprot:1155545-Pelagomonas_calceolata.AAC.16
MLCFGLPVLARDWKSQPYWIEGEEGPAFVEPSGFSSSCNSQPLLVINLREAISETQLTESVKRKPI